MLTTADILAHLIRSEIKSLRFGKHLNQSQKNILRGVLMKNEDAFQWDTKTIGRTKLVEHCIPTADNRPIQQSQYPIPIQSLMLIGHFGKSVYERRINVKQRLRWMEDCSNLM